MEFLSHNAEETEAFAESLARALFPGAVVALWGGLGAGKTAFTRGLARGLAVTGRVTSPTFTLVHEHHGSPSLNHFDLYRLDEGSLEDMGFEEYLEGSAICAIEWPGNAGSLLPEERLDVTLELAEDGNARHITISAKGRRYEALLEGLKL